MEQVQSQQQQKSKLSISKQQKSAHQIQIQNFNSHTAINTNIIDGVHSQDNTPISIITKANDNASPFRKEYDYYVKKQTKNLKVKDKSQISESNKHSNKHLEQYAVSSQNPYQSIELQHQSLQQQQQQQIIIKQEITLAKRFKLQINLENKKNKIGLYIGRDTMLNQDVAIKLFGGKKPKPSKSQYQFFNQEREILLKLRNYEGFSRIIENGYEEECDLYYIVMQKLDEDLNSVVKKAEGGRLSLQTVINIGIEMISRLETLHELGIVHRDLKPKNIMINFKQNEVVLIDFGLSNKFKSQYQTHIQYRSTKKILGTPLYASNNALLGKEISRRDDIESLVYILIFALKGYLPWKGQLKLDFLKSPSAKNKIIQWRDPYGELCQDIDLEFREMLDYAQKLEFEEEPDYEYLESLLQVIKERNDFDDTFDWHNKQCNIENKNNHQQIKTKIVIQDEEQEQPYYQQQQDQQNHEIQQQDQNHLHLNMPNDLRQTLKKNVKYRTVRKLKKGASGVLNKNDHTELLTITKEHSNNAQSDQLQDNIQKGNLLKVSRNNHSKKRVKVSNKQILHSPNITEAVMQTPDCTKIINSNNVSNNVSNNGDKSNFSLENPISQDNIQRSDSIHINFNNNNINQDNDHRNNKININEEDDDDLDNYQEELMPSEELEHHNQLSNEFIICSGTAGIDFDHSKYWDQDSLDEGFNIIKNVPEFNNKRTIIQRNSEILENYDRSPLRINKLNSCTDLKNDNNQ